MAGNRHLKYSLRAFFATVSLGTVMGSLWRQIGLASIPATLSVGCVFLSLWEWLSRFGVTRSCTRVSVTTLILSAAIMAHITLLMAFIPQAARIAAEKCGDRYGFEYDPELPIEWEEWSTSNQLERVVAKLIVFGYPGLILVAIGSAIIGRLWNVRGLAHAAIGCYLVIMPLCVGYLQTAL